MQNSPNEHCLPCLQKWITVPKTVLSGGTVCTTPRMCPKSTSNVEQAKSDIDEYGYCLIENALEPAVVDAALSRLKEQAAAELELGAAFEDGGPKQQWGAFTDGKGRPRQQAYTAEAGGVNQRVWMLVNKGRIFRQILFTRRVRDVVDHVLGDDYLLSSYSANIAKPGGVAMNLHTDQWWMPHPINREPSPVPVGSISRQRSNLAGEDPPQMIAPLRMRQCNVDA